MDKDIYKIYILKKKKKRAYVTIPFFAFSFNKFQKLLLVLVS